MSTIKNLKELRLDLTSVENVEIVLRNLPNLKMLNDKDIKPDLFSEDNPEDKNSKENNENINENNNNKIIIEQHYSYQNDIDLPDSSIESEIQNYDVSNNILFKFK